MSYESDYNAKSIWGEDGPPHATDTGREDALKAQGEDFSGDVRHHTAKWKEGYERGQKEYKELLMEKLLRGEVEDEDFRKIDVDKLFDRKPKKSAGGIILPFS